MDQRTTQSEIIGTLLKLARTHRNPEELVALLVKQIDGTASLDDLEYAIGGLRSAISKCAERTGAQPGDYRCNFCGRQRIDVGLLIVSAESAICDDCAIYALHTICKNPGQAHLRIAFAAFRFLATIGYVGRRLFSKGPVASKALAVRKDG